MRLVRTRVRRVRWRASLLGWRVKGKRKETKRERLNKTRERERGGRRKMVWRRKRRESWSKKDIVVLTLHWVTFTDVTWQFLVSPDSHLGSRSWRSTDRPFAVTLPLGFLGGGGPGKRGWRRGRIRRRRGRRWIHHWCHVVRAMGGILSSDILSSSGYRPFFARYGSNFARWVACRLVKEFPR